MKTKKLPVYPLSVLLAFCIAFLPVLKPVEVKANSTANEVIERLDSLMESWNSSDVTFSFHGGNGCFAWANYCLSNLFGEYDTSSLRTNGGVTTYSLSETSFSDIVQSAVPGDAIYLKNSSGGTHIVMLGWYDETELTVYDSNYANDATNIAHKNTFTYDGFIDNLLFTPTTVWVYHSGNNTAGKPGGTCQHNYTGLGVCSDCGEVFQYEVFDYNFCIPMYIADNGAPDHTAPYGAAGIQREYALWDEVLVVGYTINAYGNLWCKLEGGAWIWSNYLSSTPYLSGNVVDFLSPAIVPAVSVNTTNATAVSATNAVVWGEIFFTPGDTKIDQCGIYWGTSPENMYVAAKENVGYAANHPKNGQSFECWYDIAKETNEGPLQASTTYYWAVFAISDGVEYRGPTQAFTTEAVDSGRPLGTNSDIIAQTNTVQNLTASNAVVYGYITKPYGLEIDTCGIYFGTAPDAMKLVVEEVVSYAANHPRNRSGFEAWWDLNDECGVVLQSGQTYYWQVYCVYQGEEYLGSIESFTTL